MRVRVLVLVLASLWAAAPQGPSSRGHASGEAATSCTPPATQGHAS